MYNDYPLLKSCETGMSQPLINISRQQALYFASFLVLYQFLVYIANDMIMPGMIQVTASFHAPESAIATSLTVYVLGGASLQLFLGPVSDRFGRRPVMLTGAFIFLLFTLLIACSNSMEQFLLARYFQGMGLCFIAVIGYATLQEIFAEMDAIRLIAVLANVACLAPLLGPLAGASFILYFHWRGIFVLIGVLALLALWGIWRFMPEPVGAIKNDGERIKPAALTLRGVATNYLRLLRNPSFMLGAIASGLLAIPCIAWIALSPIILVTDAQLTVVEYALWQLPVFAAEILGSWYLRKLTHRCSIKQIILLGSTIAICGLLAACLLPFTSNGSFLYFMPGLLIYSFGQGVTTAPLIRRTLFATPISKGTAYALISMVSMCAQALGVEVANQFYATHNNSYFGLYCAIVGVLYLITLLGVFSFTRQQDNEAGLATT